MMSYYFWVHQALSHGWNPQVVMILVTIIGKRIEIGTWPHIYIHIKVWDVITHYIQNHHYRKGMDV